MVSTLDDKMRSHVYDTADRAADCSFPAARSETTARSEGPGLSALTAISGCSPSAAPDAKDRILTAAMLLFAQMPCSDTSQRDFAAAAEVDVAYIHRAFGSRPEIFRQALGALMNAICDIDRNDTVTASLDFV